MKLLYLTNIPAPYRNRRFNLMQSIFSELGIEFEVWYLAWREPNRQWEIDKTEMNYPYRVFRGIHPVWRGMFAHFNFGMLLKLMFYRYDMAVVGGMGSPSHILAPFFIIKNRIKILSVETNLRSTSKKSGFSLWVKQRLISKYKLFQVTGDTSQEYVDWLADDNAQNSFITLPNIVDSRLFKDRVIELRNKRDELIRALMLPTDRQIWLCPARLESIKGILNFVPSLAGIQNIQLVVVGSGSQKKQIIKLIKELRLPVTLINFVQQETMIKYYAVADLFVLPSLKDPSPLSPIEAAASGLPLLVSNRIGNYSDVLENETNGWGFDPENIPISLLKKISALSREQLQKKGVASMQIFDEKFEEEKCVRAYGKQLLHAYKTPVI